MRFKCAQQALEMNIDSAVVCCCQDLINSDGRLLSCWKQQTKLQLLLKLGFDNESCILL